MHITDMKIGNEKQTRKTLFNGNPPWAGVDTFKSFNNGG